MTKRGPLDADVIIVGSGGAGVAAALDAKSAGANVIILESEGELGGATAISGGGCCMVGTPFQSQHGIDDSLDLAFADWIRFGQGAADEEWVRFYIEHSCHDLFEWLSAMGVQWDGFHHQEGNTVPRWHHPVGGGKAIWQALYESALANGIDNWLLNTHATKLVTKDGRVVGLQAMDAGTGEAIDLVGKAVVMATGGFLSNLEMIYEYCPELRQYGIMAGAHVGATGSGHKMVAKIGGALTHMDHLWMYAYATRDYRDPQGDRGLVVRGLPDYIWVNAQGRRFHNESLMGGGSATPALLAQNPPFCWAIIDATMREGIEISDPYYRDGAQKHWDRIDALFEKSPYIKSAPTLRGLAGDSGLPEEVLEETVRRYNSCIDEGMEEEPDFGRPLAGQRRIEQPPFFALQFFPLARKNFGGVRTNLHCQVLDIHRAPIAGLYAAGELAGMAGGHINGKAGLEGTMLGPALFSGRVAGTWAAREAGFGPGFIGKPLR